MVMAQRHRLPLLIESCNNVIPQVFLYSSKRWTPGVREADLLLLQLVASLSDDIDAYMVSILSKYVYQCQQCLHYR